MPERRFNSAMPAIGDKITTYHSLRFGNHFRQFLQETLQIPWAMNYCNAMIGAILPSKPRIGRSELQFFSWCCNVIVMPLIIFIASYFFGTLYVIISSLMV